MPPKAKLDSNLLSTKLEIPSLGNKIVRRSRLIDLLTNGCKQNVTLITAPTGYGKTTLLIEWLSTDPDTLHHTAWVALDPFDNSVYRFWSYVTAAINQVAPHLHFNSQHILSLESDPIDFEELNPLINAVAKLSFRLTLVLDDLQSIKQHHIYRGLRYLIDHQPKNLHIVLANREALPIPLGRLRAQGRLVEVNERDLSFTISEAKSYISGVLGLNLNQETVAALQQITLGWIAGLQLAALSLKDQTGPNYSMERLSKGKQHIFSYLTEEVLNQQDPDIREFLLKTCLLSELSAPLCNELLGRSDSQAILINLERSNLFISAVDKQQMWFRYHPLFVDALAECLQQECPDLLSELHRKACSWLRTNGYPDKAVSHALEAGDLDIAAEIADSCALPAIIRYDLVSLIYWTDRFPRNLIAKYPKLGIYSAVASCQLSRVNKVEPELQIVEHALECMDKGYREKLNESHLRWEIAAVRAAVDCARGDFKKAIPNIISLQEERPEDDLYFSGWLNHYLARAYEALANFKSAAERYDQGRRFAQQYRMHKGYMHTTSALIHLYKLQGRLNQAEGECYRALDYADRENLDFCLTALPHIFITEINLEQSAGSIDDPWVNEVVAHFDQIENGSLAVSTKYLICLGLTKYFLAHQKIDQALLFLNRAIETFIPGDALLFNMLSDLVDLQVELWAATGNLHKKGDSFVQEAPFKRFARLPSDAVQGVLGRIYLSRGDTQKALQVLSDVEKAARRTGAAERLIKTLTLQGLAYLKTDQLPRTLECVDEAIGFAQPEGYLRIFISEGPACKLLFLKYLESLQIKPGPADEPKQKYVSRVIDAFEEVGSSPAVTSTHMDPQAVIILPDQARLTGREQEVLQLMAIGKSTKEIAAKLTISVNTAKTHVRNIHRKVGRNPES